MNKENRQKKITQTSGLHIIANIFIASIKVILGLATGSLAIISEGVNNASDAITAIITLVGTKLSNKHPDEKHPFGYGRVEYLTTMVLSLLIIYTGIELIKSSIDGILHPAEMTISYMSIAIVAISAIIKFFLGTYTIGVGKKVDSASLDALGVDCRNDSFLSVVTIISSFLYLLTHFSIDAIAGLVFAALILKNGFDTLMETVGDLLGRPGQEELAKQIYKEIRKTEGVINAADMMIHNYGPDSYSGSVNIEVDHKKTIGEVYEIIHDLQLRIMHEMNVTMVFGMYAVDRDHPMMMEMRKYIANFVKNTEHVSSFHALYMSPESNKIYCDLIVDYGLKDWDQLKEEFLAYMKEKYSNEVELTIETEFV